jgi:hypothetical protein
MFCVGVLMMLAISCKKDLGNYDYTVVNAPVLDTVGVPASYSIERYANLSIDPKIAMNGIDTTNLSYQWILYKATVTTGQLNTPIPISKLRKLNVPIGEPIGIYKVELVVTDTKNALKTNVVFDVSISAGMEYGLLVMHTAGGSSDVDFLVTRNAVPITSLPEKRLRNLFQQRTGARLDGEGRFISLSRRTSFTAFVTNWITAGTSSQLQRVNGNDFTFLRENQGMFLRPGQVINPQAHDLSDISSYETLINDGKLHYTNSTDQLGAAFSAPLSGDYSLAPFTVNACASALVSVGYDQKNGRFIRPSSATSGILTPFRIPASTGQAFDLTNIGKDMVGMDRGISNYTLSFFKDKTGTARWLYVINFSKSDDGLLAVASYNMSSLPDVANAILYQGNKNSNSCYYATPTKIYRYDYVSTNTASMAFEVPAGETITAMKVYKPTPNFNLTAADGRLLYVGTWNGTQGKLYELSIDPTTAAVNTTPLNVFDGFGKIISINPKPRGAGNL